MYKIFSQGLLGSNTVVVWDSETGEAMIVDCGNPVHSIFSFTHEHSFTVKYVVLTHAHFDHAEYIDQYRAAFPDAKIVAHEREIAVMSDPVSNVSAYFSTPRTYGYPDMTLREGDSIALGSMKFTVLSTPGHTPGSICLFCKEEKLLLTGDTLFAGGRGRTDFKLGCEDDMHASLRRLLALDAEITFIAGHGMPSVIGDERGRVF